MSVYGNLILHESIGDDIKKIIKGVKEKIKEKRKQKENSAKKNNKVLIYDNFTDEDIELIYNELKAIIKRVNNDPNTKKTIEASYNEYYEDDDNKKPFVFKKFVCNIWEESDTEIIFEVLDTEQDYRIIASDIVYNITKELDKICKEKNLNVGSCDYGDGDEGCVYVTCKTHYEDNK